ncbi:MAG: hypothetical protein J2P21_26400 [Chloracidobacterium sp.]|nr:hypothetical protein [Chloracidobacterium sp.]
MQTITTGQAGLSKPAGPSSELYGGIELSDEGVKAIVLQVSQDNNEDAGPKLIYKEMTRLSLGRTSNGDFPPQATADAAKTVLAALWRLRKDYRVPLDRIYLIGSSGLKADPPKDLENVIRNTTGLNLQFLDPVDEVQLSIAGTIPLTTKIGATAIDNRNTSVLFHIGGASTQGGYEMLKYAPSDSPSFDFISMSIPYGAVTYANEIGQIVDRNNSLVGPTAKLFAFSREVKASSALTFRQALRKELESKPGLMLRKRVFLTGNLVWAMATILYPGNREPFLPITYEAIAQFADRMSRSQKELFNQNLSIIRDRRLRQDVEQDLEDIKNTFTPEQLIAGAEMLKAAAEELRWQDKKIMFARNGQLGCILSYIRLQTQNPK